MSLSIQQISKDDINPEQYKKQLNVRRKSTSNGYQTVVFGTDQDLDGFHIRTLLVGFFLKYLPEFLPRIAMLNTPVVVTKKNYKVQSWKYTLDGEMEVGKGEEIEYKKGLGSYDPDEMKVIIEKDGLENMIEPIDITNDYALKCIDDWLGKDSEPRKEYVLNNDFSIAAA